MASPYFQCVHDLLVNFSANYINNKMNMDENIYGKSVRKARLKRGFSQAEMA
jgi:ribosome-binding protein aMBF1 (putative translation factor)